MHKRHPVLAVGALIAFMLTSVQLYAGGPLALLAPGVPFLWPNGGQMIPFNPDLGGLGPLTNAQAVAQSTAAFKVWADVASATRDARQPRIAAGRCRRDELRAVFLPRGT